MPLSSIFSAFLLPYVMQAVAVFIIMCPPEASHQGEASYSHYAHSGGQVKQ